MNMSQSTFASDFHSARELFIDAAEKSGAAVDSFTHPHAGPDGRPLKTDVAWVGPDNAERVLMTVSGTHGVEGFCGSGAQVDWLRRGEATRLPDGTAACLVHAINPYGFAWVRRVTHENIDLNRNWIDFDAGLPKGAGYAEIADLMCPDEWNDEARKHFDEQVRACIKSKGMKDFVQAVSGGQYTHADGVFFGGTHPSWSRTTLSAIVRQRLANAESIGVLDYHSGLGPNGYGDIISTEPLSSPAFVRAREWYGARVSSIGQSVSAAIGGDWISALAGLLAGSTVTGVAIEFGTIGPLQVLEALVADNWLHRRGVFDSAQATHIKAQLRAAFYTDNDVWRGMVLGQSLVACRQAVAGLQT